MSHETAVLIVDDKRHFDFMAPIVSRELHTARLVHADSFEEALLVLRSHEALDLVFTDWSIAGADFARALRNDPETHHTPLIAMSRSDTDALVAAALRAGANDHLVKPFLEKALVAAIRRITKNRERRHRRRVRPVGTNWVGVDLSDREERLELVDISLGGCRVRAPEALQAQFPIYRQVTVSLDHAGAPLRLSAEIIRLSHDPEGGPHAGTVMITVRFTDLSEAGDTLKQLLDDLRERWSERG